MPHAALSERDGKQYLRVPVAKASTKEEPTFVEIAIDDIPPDVYTEMVYIGFKTLANRGMTDIPGNKSATNRKLAAEKAQENVEKIKKGEVRMTGGKVKTSGAVMTEALRDARVYIRDELKRLGKKVSLIAASKITELAKQYLATPEGAELVEKAKATIAARESGAHKKVSIDLSGVQLDEGLVAKAEARKSARKKANEDLGDVDVVASVTARKRGESRANA